jgi:hypothetical protein
MKVIISGYEKSKFILPASSYLANKYLPGFDRYYLNYGEYTGQLWGNYIGLSGQSNINNWSTPIRYFFESLSDEIVIFGVDDYLINKMIDVRLYNKLLKEVKNGRPYARLCKIYFFNNIIPIDKEMFIIPKEGPYSVTAQYTIWNRKCLIKHLQSPLSAWDFETNNHQEGGIGTYQPTLSYCDWSALSRHYKGSVNIMGVSQQDINELAKLKYLKTENLICQ